MKKTMQSSQGRGDVPLSGENERISWLTALKHSWQAALRLDRSQITAFQAIRATAGFILPLIIGVMTGHVIEGVSVAGGASILAGVGLNYTARTRTRTMLLDCLAVAVSAFVGSVTGSIGWLSVLITGIWGVGAGLMVAISQSAMVIGLQATIALIILTHFALDPIHAALQAMLMFAGALLQVVLVLIPSPWQSASLERSRLRTAYRKLAEYAENMTSEQGRQQVRDALFKVQSLFPNNNLNNQQDELFPALLENVERIRLSLLLLSLARQRLVKDREEQEPMIAELDVLVQASSDALRAIADELKHARSISLPPTGCSQRIEDALNTLRQGQNPSDTVWQQIVLYGQALCEHLQEAEELVRSGKPISYYSPVSFRHLPRQAYLQLYNAQATLRANLSLHSAALRHAIRLGVTLALATALYRLLPFPVERGYWIPLTALLVLRVDFTATFTRGLARMMGTILGGVLAGLVMTFLAPSPGLLVLYESLVAYIAFSLLMANYALFSVFITIDVIFLLALVIPQAPLTAEYRVIDTTIGGFLALLVYVLWPTWERSQMTDYLVKRLDAVRRYCNAVLDIYIDPTTYDDARLNSLRLEARLSRSNAEASLIREMWEPGPPRKEIGLKQGLLEEVDRLVQYLLVLEADIQDSPSHQPLPELERFRDMAIEVLNTFATTICTGKPLTKTFDLSSVLEPLKQKSLVKAHAHEEEAKDLSIVEMEAQGIIHSLDVMQQLLIQEETGKL